MGSTQDSVSGGTVRNDLNRENYARRRDKRLYECGRFGD